MAPVTHSYDPKLVGWIQQAAKQTGADPAALLATSLQESGARFGAVGDNGSSYGPFQFHRGGALGPHDAAWANSYEAVLNRAKEFARLQVHGGPGAAAVQRPLDRSLYARGVDKYLEQARAILAKMGVTVPPPSTTPSLTKPKATLPGLPSADHADIGSPIIQSILQQNAELAGLPQPMLPPITQPTLQPAVAPKLKTQAPTASTPTVTGPVGNWFKPGMGWGGSHALALHFADLGKQLGLSVASEKRQRKLTASGNPSDHWVGSKQSYAFDMSNGSKPTPQMDRFATAVAAQLGVKNYHGGRILNITKNGYRFQILWRVAGHWDHVHVGVRKV
jgi:hypothetical protein